MNNFKKGRDPIIRIYVTKKSFTLTQEQIEKYSLYSSIYSFRKNPDINSVCSIVQSGLRVLHPDIVKEIIDYKKIIKKTKKESLLHIPPFFLCVKKVGD